MLHSKLQGWMQGSSRHIAIEVWGHSPPEANIITVPLTFLYSSLFAWIHHSIKFINWDTDCYPNIHISILTCDIFDAPILTYTWYLWCTNHQRYLLTCDIKDTSKILTYMWYLWCTNTYLHVISDIFDAPIINTNLQVISLMHPHMSCLRMRRIYKCINILLNYTSVFDLKSSQVYSLVLHYYGYFMLNTFDFKSIPCVTCSHADLNQSHV